MKEKECTVPGAGGGEPQTNKKNRQKLILGKTDPGLQSITEKANHRNSRTGRYLTQDSRQMNSHVSSQNSTLNYFFPPFLFPAFLQNVKPILTGKLTAPFHTSASPPKSTLITSFS